MNKKDSVTVDSLRGIKHLEYANRNKITDALRTFDAGEYADAEAMLRTIVPNKYNADYHRLLARFMFSSGDYTGALDHINKAIQLRKYWVEHYMERARIYYQMEEFDLAYQDLIKVHLQDGTAVDPLVPGVKLHPYGVDQACPFPFRQYG